jgi:hypothetical protein
MKSNFLIRYYVSDKSNGDNVLSHNEIKSIIHEKKEEKIIYVK